MGICDTVPGVSGGTMAVILGIYEELIRSISGLMSREWRSHLGFLFPLGIGMGAGLVGFMNIMDQLLQRYPQEIFFLFSGLLIGVLPFLWREGQQRSRFRAAHWAILMAAAAGAFFISTGASAVGGAALELTASNAWYFFLAGWAASTALLLPGVSGAFILLLFGLYETASASLSVTSPDIGVIFVLGSGVAVGALLSSKAIKWLLASVPSYTYAAIIGLILGAVTSLLPGFGAGSTLISVAAFGAGIIIAYVLSLKQP